MSAMHRDFNRNEIHLSRTRMSQNRFLASRTLLLRIQLIIPLQRHPFDVGVASRSKLQGDSYQRQSYFPQQQFSLESYAITADTDDTAVATSINISNASQPLSQFLPITTACLTAVSSRVIHGEAADTVNVAATTSI